MSDGRDEKCRVLSEWLGFHVRTEASKNPAYPVKYKLFLNERGWVNSAGLFGHGWHCIEEHAWYHAPDFYTSESASALILDRLRDVDTDLANDTLRRLFNELLRTRLDRKELIAETAYAVAMAEKEKR